MQFSMIFSNLFNNISMSIITENLYYRVRDRQLLDVMLTLI